MKKTKLFVLMLLLGVFGFGINWAISSGHRSDKETRNMVNTKIDNLKYWVKLAEAGIIEFNPEVKTEPAIYTGSKIKGFTVITEDSPDVPVTEVNSTQSENSVFVDPNDNSIVLNSNNSTQNPVGNLYGANDFYSFNSGEIWEGEVQGAGGSNSGDPTTSIGLNGRWYVNYIDTPGGMGISYSDDQGDTWSTNTVVPNPGDLADKNHMWIDNSLTSPYEGDVYIAWTNFGGSSDSEIGISSTNDDGITWNTNYNISSAVNAGSHNQGVNIGTGPDGEVYAIWGIYDGWPTDEAAIGMAKSFDGGATWEPATRVIPNIRGIRTTETSKNMRVNSFPVCAVDCSNGPDRGAVYITWSNIGTPGINTGSDIDVYVAKSSNQGDSWSDPVRVNQDPAGLGKEHFFPWIACDAANGILSVIFYDDRNVNSNQLETFCANSDDGGLTWEDFQVSDVSFTPAPIAGLAGDYFGDYLGISAQDGMVYPVWTDNRSGSAMTYCSPYETNPLNKPRDLAGVVDFETGECSLIWSYEEAENFLNFKLYRDGEFFAETNDTTFTDVLPYYGIYGYQVTAFYAGDMESSAAGVTVQWGDAHISVSPLSIFEQLLVDSTSTKQIEVVNTGQLELIYDITPVIDFSKESLDYCAASGGGDEYISNVEVGDISNSSVSDEYSDYTNLSTTMEIGQSYEITITNGNPYDPDQCGIWIDWDQNGEFDEDMIDMGTGNGPYTNNITPPQGSLPGETRMRVRIIYTGTLDPCGTTQYGEVEDYTINVQGWLNIDPLAGSVMPGDTSIVIVNFDSHGMEAGLYTATAIFTSNDPIAPSVDVDISLLISSIIVEMSSDNESVCVGEETEIFTEVYGSGDTITYSWSSIPEGFESADDSVIVAPEVPTWYFVNVTDNNNNTAQDSLFVNVYDLPIIELGNDTILCGDLWTLDAGNEGSTYLWSNGDTTQTVVVDTLGHGYGVQDITVEVTNVNGCISDGLISIDFINCTGIDELNSVNVSIYPNPSNGIYNLTFNSIKNVDVQLFVVSNAGGIVYQNNNLSLKGKTNLRIDISNNASGVYQLIIKSKTGLINKKLIIK